MEIKLLEKSDINIIKNLYNDIRNNTYTIWENDYPSKELINWDIERKGLWGVFENDNLIAIGFAGERCEDSEENFPWKESFIRRGTFARIGVSPKYQNQGVGTFLVEYVLTKLKDQGFDGVRIMVGAKNINAKKLYLKFGFKNCGKVERFGQEYFLFELRLI